VDAVAFTWYVFIGASTTVARRVARARMRGSRPRPRDDREPRRAASSTTRSGARFPARRSTSDRSRSIWSERSVTLTFEARAPAALDTPFDLASLTKVDRDDDRRHGAGADRRASARRAGRRFFADWRGDGSRRA
jgi:hypothetical protein